MKGAVQFNGIVTYNVTQLEYTLCRLEHPGDPGACQALYDLASTAGVEADLYPTHAAEAVINHFTIEHPLVIDPPVDVAILSPEGQPVAQQTLSRAKAPSLLSPAALEEALALPPIYVRSGVNILEGSAVDPSGVSNVRVQILDPYGDTSDTTCDVAAPMSGVWSCAVNLQGAQNDARYFGRVRATNAYGYTSEWSAWRVLLVDTLPPTASLDIASQSTLTATVIGPVNTVLSGLIQDNRMVKSVDFCQRTAEDQAAESCQAVELSSNNVLTGTWSTNLVLPLGVDYASQTLSLYGWDAAGNRSAQPQEYTFWYDTAAPNVAVTRRVPSVALGTYSTNPQPILAGTASDGSGFVEIVVRMTSAETGTQRTVIPVQDNQWSYLPEINDTGIFSLSLEGRDSAGNLTSLGSWRFEVVDGYALWLPFLNR
jgi:hypothetical protein